MDKFKVLRGMVGMFAETLRAQSLRPREEGLKSVEAKVFEQVSNELHEILELFDEE